MFANHPRVLVATIAFTLLVTVSCSLPRRFRSAAKFDSPPQSELTFESNQDVELVTSTESGDTAVQGVEPAVDLRMLPAVALVDPCVPTPDVPRSTDELPSRFWEMTIDEAVALALQNSQIIRNLGGRIVTAPSAAVTAMDAAIVENDPLLGTHAALSQFDTSFSTRFFYEKNDRAFNNVTLGGGAQELVQDLNTWQTEWQRTSRLGTRMALRNLTSYDDNNRLNNLFRNSWDSQWQAELRQPLLQGAGYEFNDLAGPNARLGFNFSSGIVIARLNRNISDVDFELAVRELIGNVQRTYWNLQLAYQDYHSRVHAREAAHRTWQATRARAEQQLRGGEADKEAQSRAQYYFYEDLCIEALNGNSAAPGIYGTERQLRHLLGLPATDHQLIRPISVVAMAEMVYDFASLKQQALTQRAELRQQMLRVRQHEYRLLAAKNFLSPRLDATAQYRLRGFGDDLAGKGPRFQSAYQDIAAFDHQEWGFGLELNAQLGFRQAQAAVRQASLQLARERVILAEQELAISHALSDAVAQVAQIHASMQAAEQRVLSTQARVAATEAAFTADQSSVDMLLDAQEKQYHAAYRYHQLQAAYSVALWEVEQQSGELLTIVN